MYPPNLTLAHLVTLSSPCDEVCKCYIFIFMEGIHFIHQYY